jgi:DNA modification methylase
LKNLIRALEKKYCLTQDSDFKKLVNFSEYNEQPFQRWFYYQEGYSSKLLGHLYEKNLLPKSLELIVDPFCGSGSTLIASKQKNIKSIGIDINPVSAFMAKVKTENYTKKEISETENFSLSNISKYKEEVYENYELRIIKNLFSLRNLSQIEEAKIQINTVKSERVKNLLRASLISVLEDVSNYKKAGNGLKKKRDEPKTEFGELFREKKKQICIDIKESKTRTKTKVYLGSCELIQQKVHDSEVDLFLFSPPYANCFDYFEVYKIELWLGGFVSSYEELRKLRKSALVSNLNADLNKDFQNKIKSKLFEKNIEAIESSKLHDPKIPKMIRLYFQEMQDLLKMSYDKLKSSGKMIIVVGNSSYGGQPLLTDLILANLAESIGYRIEQIIVARKNETASQQYKKIGKKIRYIRESLIVLKK